MSVASLANHLIGLGPCVKVVAASGMPGGIWWARQSRRHSDETEQRISVSGEQRKIGHRSAVVVGGKRTSIVSPTSRVPDHTMAVTGG